MIARNGRLLLRSAPQIEQEVSDMCNICTPSPSHNSFCFQRSHRLLQPWLHEAASRIDIEFGRFMFGYYGAKSPFLVEELIDYYKGGKVYMEYKAVNWIAYITIIRFTRYVCQCG